MNESLKDVLKWMMVLGLIIVIVILISLTFKGYQKEAIAFEQSNFRIIDRGDPFGSGAYGALYVLHDDVRDVTCWHMDKGISCITDSQLK